MPSKRPVTVYMSDDDKDLLMQLADRDGRSMSNAVSALVRDRAMTLGIQVRDRQDTGT